MFGFFSKSAAYGAIAVKEWCGNGSPDTYQSTTGGDAVKLRWKTNEKYRGVGFVLEYREVGK